MPFYAVGTILCLCISQTINIYLASCQGVWRSFFKPDLCCSPPALSKSHQPYMIPLCFAGLYFPAFVVTSGSWKVEVKGSDERCGIQKDLWETRSKAIPSGAVQRCSRWGNTGLCVHSFTRQTALDYTPLRAGQDVSFKYKNTNNNNSCLCLWSIYHVLGGHCPKHLTWISSFISSANTMR